MGIIRSLQELRDIYKFIENHAALVPNAYVYVYVPNSDLTFDLMASVLACHSKTENIIIMKNIYDILNYMYHIEVLVFNGKMSL